MAITKRGKVYHLRFRPFGGQLITVKTPAEDKRHAMQIERAILTACQARDYRALDPEARAVCLSMFSNRRWEIPSDLGGDEPPRAELTLWDAVGIFRQYPGIKDHPSSDKYRQCLCHVLGHLGKDRTVKSIWVPDVKRYQMERSSEGASPSTINWEKGTLSRVFQVLVELQYLEVNCVRLVKNLSQKVEERMVYLSYIDVSRIMDKSPSWYRPLVMTAYYAGMRRGEIVGLRRSQLNLSNRILHLGPTDTKEGQWKRVPLRRELIPVFEECLKVRSLESDRVFLLSDGKGVREITRDTVANCWPRACKALQLEKPWPHFHDLRHTWRANARRSGIDPTIAESILGHASKGRTVNDRYGYVSDDELVRAVDSMNFDLGESKILVRK